MDAEQRRFRMHSLINVTDFLTSGSRSPLALAFSQITYWKEFNGDEAFHRDFFESHPDFWKVAQLESVFRALPAISLD